MSKDLVDASQGKMTWGRFGYHLAGFGASVYIGTQLGGLPGTVVGLGFGTSEIIYDTVIDPQIAQPFNQDFNRFFRNYFNIPGW